jgi:3-deoxy-D-manno-octulosonate 8-phosphate phosphatase (KDO 8-P phosphatase)
MLEIFEEKGAKFLVSHKEFKSRLNKIKFFIFDWDGVFNNGVKFGEQGSLFSDIDAMGINVLRFAYWLKNKDFPKTFILTGMFNNSAKKLALREHFNGIFINSKFKIDIVNKLCEEHGVTYENIAFLFDDILDLEVATKVGLALRVKRESSPMLDKFIIEKKIGHYLSANTGNNNAVREICELITGIWGNYNEVVEKRMAFKGDYEKYLLQRNDIKTKVIELKEPEK